MARKDTEALQARKARLVADLAVARAGLRRDVRDAQQLLSVPGQLRLAFKGKGGKAIAAAGVAGGAIANFFKRGIGAKSKVSEADKNTARSILDDAVRLGVDLLLRKGVDRYLDKDWQRTAARGILALLFRR